MASYAVDVLWLRDGQDFLSKRYSRRHRLRFDGGAEVLASSSPHVVPLPMSDAAGVDPEEAFVAALSSCHMLCFLAIAADHGYCVDRYADAAVGVLAKDAEGRFAMTRVTLRPAVDFAGARRPDAAALAHLHHLAHDECYIASSVKTEVVCEPAASAAPG